MRQPCCNIIFMQFRRMDKLSPFPSLAVIHAHTQHARAHTRSLLFFLLLYIGAHGQRADIGLETGTGTYRISRLHHRRKACMKKGPSSPLQSAGARGWQAGPYLSTSGCARSQPFLYAYKTTASDGATCTFPAALRKSRAPVLSAHCDLNDSHLTVLNSGNGTVPT